MANKRKGRQTPKFSCPHCQKRLWRLGSLKYHLFYQDITEIRKHLGLTRKNASFWIAQHSAYIDKNCWLEEFFCEEDGSMWLRVSQKADGTLVTSNATRNDWNQTFRTIDPDRPNPSVSEFTYRTSRGRYQVSSLK